MRWYGSIALFVALAASCACAQQVAPSPAPATPDAPKLYHIGSGVSAPTILYAAPAIFSEEARAKKITGDCLISLIVDAQGMPQDPKVIQKLGHGLDEQALASVNQYRFEPAMKDGKPVPVRIIMKVNFKLY
jgi:TonB family protein